MAKFEQLRATLLRLTQEVCEALAVNETKLPVRLWKRISRTADGQVWIQSEERPNFPLALLNLSIAALRQPIQSFEDVVVAIRTDSDIATAFLVDANGNSLPDDAKLSRLIIDNIWKNFLAAYFDRTNSAPFDKAAFDSVFHDLVKSIEAPVVTVTVLSPLLNARFDADRLEVIPGLIIRKVSTDEVERWLNPSIGDPYLVMGSPEPLTYADCECAIEIQHQQGRFQGRFNEPYGSQESWRMASTLITVLRLLYDKNVAIAFTKVSSDSILSPEGGTSWPLSTPSPVNPADITTADQPKIYQLWKRIHSLKDSDQKSLALRRWNYAVDRTNQDDAFIDCWVGLEALFAPDSVQEISYRASLRIAAFLGDTPDERKKMYKDAKASYNLRSAIVHGGNAGGKDKPGLREKTRSYLHEALLKVLSSDEPFNAKSIEENLLSK